MPDEREDDNEKLEEGHRHDDKVNGGGVDLPVDFAGRVHEGQVVTVNWSKKKANAVISADKKKRTANLRRKCNPIHKTELRAYVRTSYLRTVPRVAEPCHFEAAPAPPIFFTAPEPAPTYLLHAWVRWGRFRPAEVFK